uniref:F-box domain-containing protein n=1 Tax=Mycena chlorophos TaxID=658473 RepID=A0ABQ0M5G9_MYCCL|nr:predicted protein [Mycena chlorophos]
MRSGAFTLSAPHPSVRNFAFSPSPWCSRAARVGVGAGIRQAVKKAGAMSALVTSNQNAVDSRIGKALLTASMQQAELCDIEPRLPPELERAIFEVAASHNLRVSSNLCFVARRIEPFLYRVFLLSDIEHTENFGKLLMKRPDIVKQHVQRLALTGSTSRTQVRQILAICTNLIELCFWSSPHPDLLKDMQQLSLTRLSINLSAIFTSPTALEFEIPAQSMLGPFRCMTHLDVFNSNPSALVPFLVNDTFLPRLTHLSFTDVYSRDPIRRILAARPTLHVLAVLQTSFKYMDIYADHPDAASVRVVAKDSTLADAEDEIDDPRFCVGRLSNYTEDWVRGAWGGRDAWVRAEERVTERKEVLQKRKLAQG